LSKKTAIYQDIIYGEEESIEYLISEASYYKSNLINVPFSKIDYEDEEYSVLSQDLEFFNM